MRTVPAIGVFIAVTFVILALFGPYLAPYDPESIDLAHQFELPSFEHPLGTADNGVDILSVLLHGARLSGVVAASVIAISLAIGILLGTMAGYFGRAIDDGVTGLADLLQSFPAIILQIAILAAVDRPGLGHLIFALSVPGWVLYARLARAQAFSLREREFVFAARALGMSQPRIVVRHLVPNLMGPLVIQATTGLGGVLIAESTLSFLGLGPGKGVSWGALLDQGTGVLLRFPHVALIAGGALALTVLAFNLAGDFLRDQLDPRP